MHNDSAVEEPLSAGQEGLWFLEQLIPGNAAYHIGKAFRLVGQVNVEALQSSLLAATQRHSALRMVFRAPAGLPTQVILPDVHVPLEFVDLSEIPPAARDRALESHISAAARTPFDLQLGPPIRVWLFRHQPLEHVLLVVVHHIVADGWSMTNLFRDIGAFYRRTTQGEEQSLPELPLRYLDYVARQNQQLSTGAFDETARYWREQLVGLAPLNLKLDRPRPAIQSFNGASHRFVLPPKLRDRLNDLARSADATLFIALLAGFAAYLHRETRQPDIAIGVPVAGRRGSYLEPMVGYFVNTIVVRTSTSGEPSGREFIRQVRERCLDAYAHQDLPFPAVVRLLQLPHDPSRSPIIQTSLIYNNMPRPDFTLPGVVSEPMPVDTRATTLDLALFVEDHVDGLRCNLEYNPDLFDASRVCRFASGLHAWLCELVAEPDQRAYSTVLGISSVSVDQAAHSTPMRQQPKQENTRLARLGADELIHLQFESHVREHETAPAVVSAHDTLSYGELNSLANMFASRIAVHLNTTAPVRRVALLFDNVPTAIAAMLGVLKTGAAYVPLDPQSPEERNRFILNDSGTRLLLCDESSRPLADRIATCPVVELHGVLVDKPQAQFTSPFAPAAPTDPAYVLYTSGSTGVPKGVIQPHRNILHFTRCYAGGLRISSTDRLSLLPSYSVGAAVLDIYAALLNGASLHPFKLRAHGFAALTRWLNTEQITVFHTTASVFRHFTHTLEGTVRFPCMRVVDLGSEQTYKDDVQRFFEFFDGCMLVNGFGTTENQVITQYHMRGMQDLPTSMVPIGFPVADTEIILLDEDANPTSGEVGEIGVKCQFVASGYWNRPELTSTVFINDPAGGLEPVYRTGDLGRFNTDGALEYLGRRDFQVKIRGFRVEVAEIETTLLEYPWTQQAVVRAWEEAGEKSLTAYVVWNPGTPAKRRSPMALKRWLSDKLPQYMLPAQFVSLKSLPTTTSGKIDRKALPAPNLSRGRRRHGSRQPTTAIERTLLEICREAMEREDIGVEDNFFLAGGHSLLAMRVLARITEYFKIDVSVRQFFEADSILDLAIVLERMLKEA